MKFCSAMSWQQETFGIDWDKIILLEQYYWDNIIVTILLGQYYIIGTILLEKHHWDNIICITLCYWDKIILLGQHFILL